MTTTFFARKVREHNALRINKLADALKHPTTAVWFETRDFGWILSRTNERGIRKILLKS
jgi:hypothetical protein